MEYSKWLFKGGCHIPDQKEPVSLQPVLNADIPERVYMATAQHIGAPAIPIVQKGDEVKLGQLICEAQGFVSAPIHASVSGTVEGIQVLPLADGRFVDCVVIANDGNDTTAPELLIEGQFAEGITAEKIIEKIKDCGVVGLGGAAFPTNIKYLPNKDGKKAECIIINAIECEPYISDDYRSMLEQSDRIIRGIRYLMKAADCQTAYIAIEDNKKDAYEYLVQKTKDVQGITPVLCREKFPQGSEKHLIYSMTGREVPAGGLPIEVGVIVNNVGTAMAVADAVEKNQPIFERVITVNGSGVRRPGNYLVRIGTLYSDVAKSAGGVTDNVIKLINGGPMMGFAVPHLEMPVIKNTTALLFMTQGDLPAYYGERHCVRCARCLAACPMQLEPTRMMHAVKRKDWDAAQEADLLSCIECGSCTYECPAHIPLVQYFRLGKQYLNGGQGAKNPAFARVDQME